MKTYSEKLKDPRWQRKRLEILQRDNFSCHICGDEKSTLHVHHREYENSEPWEIENFKLITLCEKCHSHYSEIDDLIPLVNTKMYNHDILGMIYGLTNYQPKSETIRTQTFQVLFWFLSNSKFRKYIIGKTKDYIKKNSPEILKTFEGNN